MKVLVSCRLYPGPVELDAAGWAGAELMQQVINRELVRRGHQVTVGVVQGVDEWRHEGVPVQPMRTAAQGSYDVVIAYLEGTSPGRGVAREQGARFVHILHNEWSSREPADLSVSNSVWLADRLGVECVCRPPVLRQDYETRNRRRDAILLVNLSDLKGAPIFYKLAKAFPHRRFIGVIGAYGHQMIHHQRNVMILPHTADMRSIYRQARIVLLPSSYESWGRVAAEAAMSGIPVVATPTEGLVECLGEAGIYCYRHLTEDWTATIRCLDDADHYRCHSKASRARGRDLDVQAKAEVGNLVDRIESL